MTTPSETAEQAPENEHDGKPTHPGVALSPTGIVPESDVRLHTPSSAAPQPSHGLVEGLGELPQSYGDGRLVALVRDPSTLWVYWDFSPQQLEQAFAGLGAARAVLRIWNTRSSDLVRDEEVHLQVRGWYLRNLTPGSEVRVELWAVGEKGQRMLRSGRPVRLPPAVQSEQFEAFFVEVPVDQSLREVRANSRPLQYGGAAPQEWDRRLQPRATELPSSHGPHSSSHPSQLPTSPGQRLPWSLTHVPDLGKGQ